MAISHSHCADEWNCLHLCRFVLACSVVSFLSLNFPMYVLEFSDCGPQKMQRV